MFQNTRDLYLNFIVYFGDKDIRRQKYIYLCFFYTLTKDRETRMLVSRRRRRRRRCGDVQRKAKSRAPCIHTRYIERDRPLTLDQVCILRNARKIVNSLTSILSWRNNDLNYISLCIQIIRFIYIYIKQHWFTSVSS